jgi:hypothetical protein
VKADHLLAKIALDVAHNTSPPEKHNKFKQYQKTIEKADKYFEEALDYMDKERPLLAIEYFGKSWEYSQQARLYGH